MKIDLTQNAAHGRLEISMSENCYGDSTPVLRAVAFSRFHQKIAPDTAALAAAIIASRWCGEFLEFATLRISPDFGEAIQAIIEDVRFVQPIDGFRRHLCTGRLDILAADAADAACVLGVQPRDGMTRLVTWNGEFVDQRERSSAGHMAGEITTNANVLLPDWEVSVALALLIGGLSLRSITVPQPAVDSDDGAVERIARALHIAGVQLSVAPRSAPAARPVAPRASRRRTRQRSPEPVA